MKMTDMKQVLPAFFVVLCVSASLVLMPMKPARAADAVQFPSAVVAIVDMQTIMSQSKAAKSVNAQVQKHRQVILDKLAKLEKDLREREQELQKQAALVSPEALAGKRKEYETKRLEGKELVQTGRKIDAARNTSLAELQKQVALIIADVAKSHGITVVLPGDVILLADSNINITGEVLAILDKKITQIKVEMPAK